MADESVLTDELKAMVGKESPPVTFELDKTTLRLFARAVGHTDPIYYDEAAAKSKGYRSLPAPPGFLGYAIFDPRTADQPVGPSMPVTRLTRRLNGGTEYEYFTKDICAGDTLVARGQITSIIERQGSIGLMLITSREMVYKRGSEVVAVMRGTSIQY